MGVVRVTYRPDQPGRVKPYPNSPYLPFGAFCVSPRMQGLVMKISRDTAVIAQMLSPDGPDKDNRQDGAPKYRDSFIVKVGEVIKIDGLKRVTGLVGNTDPKAAAIEFGSGEGSTDAEDRPQGGGNLPFRVLGKAGRIMGDFHGE